MSRKKRGKAAGASFAPSPNPSPGSQIPIPVVPSLLAGAAGRDSEASAGEPAGAPEVLSAAPSAETPSAERYVSTEQASAEPPSADAPSAGPALAPSEADAPSQRPSTAPEAPRAALARADTPIVGTDTPITGEILKRVRESKGVTLKEISDKTRIGRRNLEALEEERFEELPDAKIYIRGFVRCLALELGLDPERVTTSYLVRWDHWYEGQNFPKKRALRGRP